MTYLDAALAVLKTAQRPLTAREIAAEAIRRGLLKPAGKTPEATMSAALYTRSEPATGQRLKRIFEPGPNRARRGSVRWTVENSGSQ
jgi:hypothetical protein